MTRAEISKMFNGRLHVHAALRTHILRVIAALPDDIIEHITSNCWILGSIEDAWAYTFRGDELKENHLIIVSDELLKQPVPDIEWTILHEIGHVILEHRNSILVHQTPAEIKRQEQEADEFATRYFPLKRPV